jgi:hypothetical protein
MKKVNKILKTLKYENLSMDFYFKLNKALDGIDTKRKNNVFFMDFQLIFRTGLVFAILFLGSVITFKVVKDNRSSTSPVLIQTQQKTEVASVNIADDDLIKKETKADTINPEQKTVIVKNIKIPSTFTRQPVEIEYTKPAVPYSLVSDGQSNYKKTINRVYMQPIPAKSYYELDQIQNEFKVKNFIIDNKETYENIRLKYDINITPKVDFNSEMIILIALDDESSNNCSIEIVNALMEINRIVVYYRINRINEYDELNATSGKYDLKIISKTQLPVVFRRIQ